MSGSGLDQRSHGAAATPEPRPRTGTTAKAAGRTARPARRIADPRSQERAPPVARRARTGRGVPAPT